MLESERDRNVRIATARLELVTAIERTRVAYKLTRIELIALLVDCIHSDTRDALKHSRRKRVPDVKD